MTDPLTIVFMPESAYGPTNNCIGIGKILEQRGHRIVFAAEASWKGRLEPLGFEEDLVDLAPPATGDQDAGQFWTDFITETAPEFRKPTIEQLDTFIRPVWESLDRRGEVLRAAAPGDPRQSPARRDRRGQRERFPGAAHQRGAVGAHHELQPARDEGPRPAAHVQRVSHRGPRRLGRVPSRVRQNPSGALVGLQRVDARAGSAALARPRVHPRVGPPEPLRLPRRRRLPALEPAGTDVAPSRVLCA